MTFLMVYNFCVNILGKIVPGWFIESIGLIGLVLLTLGAIHLVKPLIKSNKEINAISNYKNSGAILSRGHKTEVNIQLKNNLKKDRDAGFNGAMFIFVGFTLQLLEKLINLFYPNSSMPNGINWFFLIILLVALFIMDYKIIKRMLKKKKEYEQN